jgi:hypothetical protein
VGEQYRTLSTSLCISLHSPVNSSLLGLNVLLDTLIWKPVYIYDIPQFFLKWEMFQTTVAEKTKRHLLCSINSFSRKSCRLEITCKTMVQPDRTQWQ